MGYPITNLIEDLKKIKETHDSVKTYLNIIRTILNEFLYYTRNSFDEDIKKRIRLLINNAIYKNRELRDVIMKITREFEIY